MTATNVCLMLLSVSSVILSLLVRSLNRRVSDLEADARYTEQDLCELRKQVLELLRHAISARGNKI